MRIKKVIAFLLSFVMSSMAFTINVTAEELEVNGKSAILMEQSTGKILFDKNSHEKLAPASITKIMTMLLIFEAVENGRIKLDEMAVTSDHAASMGGSQVFLEAGEQQTVQDLIKCIAIASANDAAVTMAEHIAGSEEKFVEMMNQKAKDLGMNDTTFKNACGLDTDGHVSSAYDIAIMSRELISKYPQIFEYTKIWQDTITHKTRKGETEFGLTNTNKLLKWYSEYATGLKTGSTSSALYCISSTASKDGMQLIGVVMGAPDHKTRFREAIKVLEYGFANYALVKGDEAGTEFGKVPVFKGKQEEVSAVTKETVQILLNKENSQITDKKAELYETVNAPVNKDDKLGEVVYYSGETEVARVELVAAEDVPTAGFKAMLDKILKEGLFK